MSQSSLGIDDLFGYSIEIDVSVYRGVIAVSLLSNGIHVAIASDAEVAREEQVIEKPRVAICDVSRWHMKLPIAFDLVNMTKAVPH